MTFLLVIVLFPYFKSLRSELSLNRRRGGVGLFFVHFQGFEFSSQNTGRLQRFAVFIKGRHLGHLVFCVLAIFPFFKFGAQFLGTLGILKWGKILGDFSTFLHIVKRVKLTLMALRVSSSSSSSSDSVDDE